MAKGVIDYAGEVILDRTPARRFGSDNDMKGPALFLASSASDYVFGHILAVDGGMSALI
jgi:gluconate 5-dehydrogenase